MWVTPGRASGRKNSAPIHFINTPEYINIGKIRNLLLYDACSTITYALGCQLDYCNSIMYNVHRNKTDQLQRFQNQCARIMTKSPRRE